VPELTQGKAAKKGGRPTLCTPTNIRLVSEGIRKGLSLNAACEVVGIGASTANAWMNGKMMKHRRFQEAVKRAQADREQQLVDRLTELQAHPLDPGVALRAVTFELERRHGWTKTQAVEVTGAGGGPVRVDVDPADAIRALAPLTGAGG
jgi:hypothetical protein